MPYDYEVNHPTPIMSELKEYHFTDEQIDFLLKCVVQSSRHVQDKSIDWIAELANQIDDQIVNHPTND